VPSGNLPDGTAVTLENKFASDWSVALTIPFGKLPNGTGW